jgi:hypothetical protein
MAWCKYYKAEVPILGSVKNRECTATGQSIDEFKAKQTCQGDYSKCMTYQKKK